MTAPDEISPDPADGGLVHDEPTGSSRSHATGRWEPGARTGGWGSSHAGSRSTRASSGRPHGSAWASARLRMPRRGSASLEALSEPEAASGGLVIRGRPCAAGTGQWRCAGVRDKCITWRWRAPAVIRTDLSDGGGTRRSSEAPRGAGRAVAAASPSVPRTSAREGRPAPTWSTVVITRPAPGPRASVPLQTDARGGAHMPRPSPSGSRCAHA
jgi:hypothetical protein